MRSFSYLQNPTVRFGSVRIMFSIFIRCGAVRFGENQGKTAPHRSRTVAILLDFKDLRPTVRFGADLKL